MNQFFENSIYFGVVLTIVGYMLGRAVNRRVKQINPLITAILFVILVLYMFHIDYETYKYSANLISKLITPATVSLAVPLYHQISVLKNNYKEIFIGILSGVITSMGSIFIMSYLFGLTHIQYVTLLPKSITSAIGSGISAELGGTVNVTIAVIVATGVLGNIFAEEILSLFRIKHSVAKGLAIGTAAHAIGTTKALEMGETEGAMSSVSIVVSGLITAVCASFFASLY